MDYGLAIGIDNYLHLRPPTVFAENDAQGFADALEEVYGIPNPRVVLGSDATFMNVGREIRQLVSKAGKDDRIFFFYAGHGENFDGIPHISVYDSDDDQGSWHNLVKIIENIGSSGCVRSLFFIDACESTIGLGTRRAKAAKFSIAELDAHHKDATYCSVFSSCSNKGVASVMPDKQHGIWTYFLLKALRGTDTAALDGIKLTNHSLQTFLSIKVKDYCKGSPDAPEIQTAFTWGKNQGQFVIHEFPPRHLEAVPKYDKIPDESVKRIELLSFVREDVKSLSGFKKRFHRVPEYHSGAVDSFIATISTQEINDHIDEVSTKLIRSLELKVDDYSVDKGDGYASFECPYFRYDYSVEIDKKDLSQVKFRAALTPYDLSKIIGFASELDDCFPTWFDFLDFTLNNEIDVKQLIRRLEQADDTVLSDFSYDHDPEATRVEFTSTRLNRTIIVRKKLVRIRFRAREPVDQMFEGLRDLSNQLKLLSADYRLLE